MFFPDLEAAKALSDDYKMVPVMAQYYADTETPISVFLKLRTKANCFLLESVEQGTERSRYSFLGRNPFLVFKSYGNRVIISDGQKDREFEGDPMKELEKLTNEYQTPKIDGFPVFSGGAVGYFGYDTVRLYERLENPPEDDLGIPTFNFMFVDEVIAFDHLEQKLHIIVNMRTAGDPERNYQRAQMRIMEIKQELDNSQIKASTRDVRYRETFNIQSNMDKQEYFGKVEKAKEYIRDGDVFQVVLAQRFSINTTVDPFSAYRAMRLINPSPYMYFLDFGEYQIAGASPELLVKVHDDNVYTSPIAGTRKRGSTPKEDDIMCNDLTDDAKENAEHVMLVDLGRNDIGKVSEFGTVKVTRYKYLQKFSHVIHMTSDVQGKLRKDKTAFDALAAAFPAGTLSGAPKVRAMEIIDELETKRRGIYGGAIGYVSFNGNFDSCITIRTALFKDGTAYVGAGGGVVYDSVPENEYNESVNKSAAVFRSIEEAGDIQ